MTKRPVGITAANKRSFVRDGYLKVIGAVPQAACDRALRAINRVLGEKRESSVTPDHVAYFSELFEAPELMDLLFATPLWGKIESLIGPGQVERPQAETTLGFPNADSQVAFNGKELHIDGFPDKGRYQETYTLNVGVFLSDSAEPNAGNFKVCPGSHRDVAERVRRRGVEDINGHVGGKRWPKERQLLTRAGDAVLCHYNLVHARQWNSTQNIRYAVFFRVKRVGHAARWREVLSQLWLEWDGLREQTNGARHA